MQHEHVIQLLEHYQPSDSAELQAKQQMLAVLATRPNCFERSDHLGHFTASAWLLDASGDRFLLMHHAKLQKWLQPGGHCDGDMDLLSVAMKEAQEESGIGSIVALAPSIFDIDVHDIPERKQVAAHQHYDVRFLLQAKHDEPLQANHESMQLEWFGRDSDLLPTQERSVLRMFDKWISL